MKKFHTCWMNSQTIMLRAIIAMPSLKFFGGEFMLFCKKKSLWKNLRKYFFDYKLCFFRKISALVQNPKVEKSGRLPWSKKPTYQNTWLWMMVIPTKCNNSYILSLWIKVICLSELANFNHLFLSYVQFHPQLITALVLPIPVCKFSLGKGVYPD